MTKKKPDFNVTLGKLLIDQTVLDLIARDYVKEPESLIYDMLDETKFLDKLQEEDEE